MKMQVRKAEAPASQGKTEAEQVNDVQSIIDRMARLPQGALHPETIPKDDPQDSAFSKAVVQWRFVQKEYQRLHARTVEESTVTQPEPDIELFHALSVSILTHIQKQAAIKYAVQDAGFNIIRRGVQVDLKTDQLRRYLDELEGIRVADELVSLFGLHEFRHEIILREIDRVFGQAASLESEKRKRDAEETQYRQDMLDLAVDTARGVKDVSSALRSTTSAPSSYRAPASRRGRSNGRQPKPDRSEESQ